MPSGSTGYLLQFLLRHGYVVLFGFVLAEQIGLPLPAAPSLLAMGALIGRGHFSFPRALVLATIAATFSDWVWYLIGRSRGHSVLKLICRLSLEPDSCVRRSTDVLARYGLRTLLFAKFVPGLNTIAPPMAGLSSRSLWAFLGWDTAGSLLWSGSFLAAGYIFSSELERVAEAGLHLGSWLLVILGILLGAWISWKYIQRRRFLHSLRVDRVEPKDLKLRLDAGDVVAIIDLRHPGEVASDGFTLPGALRMRPDQLESDPGLIPLGGEVVLYCS
jgi:membrane protein DedA with SNARE-associated domain